MRLNRNQIRNLILREVKSLSLIAEGVDKEIEKKFGGKNKAVGYKSFQNVGMINTAKDAACKQAKSKGGKGKEDIRTYGGSDGKTYVVCIMNK